MYNLAILASGNGSTGEVLFDLAKLVIVSNPDAGIIKRVEDYNKNSEKNLKLMVISRNDFPDRDSFGEELLKILEENQIDFISQNGWTVYTPVNVLEKYKRKITNAHPGPLDPGHPDFGGKGMNDLAVHQTVLNFRKKVNRLFKTEIDLHLVTEEFDKGELVAFKEVDVLDSDDANSLQQRVKEEEKKLLKEFWTKTLESGEIPVIKRSERVIKPGEENLLGQAKAEVL